MTKKCRKCSTTKPRTEFYKLADTRDGHMALCKVCERERALTRYYDNRSNYLTLTKTKEWREMRKTREALRRKKEALNGNASTDGKTRSGIDANG